MEQRASPRIAIDLPVVVTHHGAGRLHGTARNLSRAGMYVEIAEVDAPGGGAICVHFTLKIDEQYYPICVDGQIAHSAGRGTGLWLRDLDAQTYQRLEQYYSPAH